MYLEVLCSTLKTGSNEALFLRRAWCNAVGSAMVFELWRIDSENEMLRQRTQEYEQDVERLISTAQLQLGHQNAKQKLQYHLRSALNPATKYAAQPVTGPQSREA